MKRREFLGLMLASTAPSAGAASQKRVGVLSWHRERGSWEPAARKDFLSLMASRGFADGSQAKYEWRYSEHQVARVEPLAMELVRMRPDAILAFGSLVTRPLAAATSTIPIVCACLDAVREGYSGALGRPTRNVTGFSSAVTDTASKELDILKSLMPSLDRLAILSPASSPVTVQDLTPLLVDAARKAHLAVVEKQVEGPTQVREALAGLRREGFTVVITVNVMDDQQELVRMGLENRLAIIEVGFPNARSGALMSYRADMDGFFELIARQLEKVLRGVPLRDIPFEMPTRFWLAINRRTATTLGITIPRDVLLRADEVFD